MAQRKAFPLRLDPALYEALQRWAGMELRSLNGQIEFILRRALQDAGRLPAPKSSNIAESGDAKESEDNS